MRHRDAGVDRAELIDQLMSGKAKYSSIFIPYSDVGDIGSRVVR